MNAHLQPIENLTPVSDQAGVWLDPNACLGLRFPATGCQACSEVCPQQVLHISDQGFRLEEGCVECGRCASVCPSAALAVAGYGGDDAGSAAASLGVIRIECQRVAKDALAQGSWVLPCLGGLSASQLLAHLDLQGNRLELLDHGWCAHCACGGSEEHPARPQVDQVRALLRDLGQEPARVSILHQPLADPLPLAGGGRQNAMLERQLDRRGFMRHLISHAAAVAQLVGHHAEPIKPQTKDGMARIIPTERLALLAQCQRLAAAAAPLPARLFHQVTIRHQACSHHLVCVATCPVTALRTYQDQQGGGLAFYPQLCIGCGECQRHCPEQALKAEPAEVPQWQWQPQRLTSHLQQSCFGCGHEFLTDAASQDADHEPYCQACRKTQELGRSLFGGMQ